MTTTPLFLGLDVGTQSVRAALTDPRGNCLAFATAPLDRALLWMDQRSFREAADISATGDPCLRYVSGVVSPEWMLPKALWLKRHQREVYDRTERMVECTDWLMYRLTGAWTLSLNHV